MENDIETFEEIELAHKDAFNRADWNAASALLRKARALCEAEGETVKQMHDGTLQRVPLA